MPTFSTPRGVLVTFHLLSLVLVTIACDSVHFSPLLNPQALCKADLIFDGLIPGPQMQLGLTRDASCSILDVVPLPGKGLGVVATTKIPGGTQIIMEEPLMSVPMPDMEPGQGFRLKDMLTNIESAFFSLSLSQQQDFLSLHDHRFPGDEDQSRLLTILRSNAYNTGDDHVGIFPRIARINHSCRPNVGNHWSVQNAKRTIYTFRDIEVGEEITVGYIPLATSIKERQARLYQYGFTCGCEACQSAESSKKRVKIADSIEILEQKVHLMGLSEKSVERMLGKALKLVEMIEEEELGDYFARAYHFAAVFHEKKGDLGKAKEWAMKELEILQIAEKDSSEAVEAIEYVDDLNVEQMMKLLTRKKI